jgi:hypothetical protein
MVTQHTLSLGSTGITSKHKSEQEIGYSLYSHFFCNTHSLYCSMKEEHMVVGTHCCNSGNRSHWNYPWITSTMTLDTIVIFIIPLEWELFESTSAFEQEVSVKWSNLLMPPSVMWQELWTAKSTLFQSCLLLIHCWAFKFRPHFKCLNLKSSGEFFAAWRKERGN